MAAFLAAFFIFHELTGKIYRAKATKVKNLCRAGDIPVSIPFLLFGKYSALSFEVFGCSDRFQK